MDRIHYDRYPRNATDDTPVEPRLRVVGVQNVDSLSPQRYSELTGRSYVSQGVYLAPR